MFHVKQINIIKMKQKGSDFSKNNKKLGQGISALIGGDRNGQSLSIFGDNDRSEKVSEIEIDKIIAGIYQPRTFFNDEYLQELSDSIKENGVIQPIIVRQIKEDDKYEIIAGERRFRASKLANLKKIPAIVKKLNNHQALEFALIENIQRQDLTVIEEAQGYKKLVDEFFYNHDQIAKKVGKSRSHISNLLRLLMLPDSIQHLINDGLITMGHARALINVENSEEIAKDILEKSLTVREVEEIARDYSKSQKNESQNRIYSLKDNSNINDLENRLSELTLMTASIKYNKYQNSGKITLKFDDYKKVNDLINILKTYESK